jgi:putative addiction module CopG family antidote
MVELSPQHQQFVDAQVSAGLFQKPAEVVGAALDLLQQRQGEYEQLRTAIEQLERGELQPFDAEDVKRRGRERQASQQ